VFTQGKSDCRKPDASEQWLSRIARGPPSSSTSGEASRSGLADLVAALEAGEIADAGLDVFEQQPLLAGHPLWTQPGVLLTPHTAGYGPILKPTRSLCELPHN
jgi:D-isomer specific 2-hydroxyacid dehydrogenase, NAD binding domain